MYNRKSLFLALVIVCLGAFSAGAAELNMQVDVATKTVTIKNLLAQPLYILSVVGGDSYLPFNAEIASGGSAQLQFKGEFPATVDYANCIPVAADAAGGIAGFQPDSNGNYRLSVQLQ